MILVAIVTAGHLFRQGGGWQSKTPVPKAAPRREAEAKTPAAENPAWFRSAGIRRRQARGPRT